MKKKKGGIKISQKIMAIEMLTMIAPGVIYLIINNYIPMAGIIIAFKKYNYQLGIFRSEWTGISNFTFLFKSSNMLTYIRNTLLYNIVFIVLGQVFAITTAILLNLVRSAGAKKVYQTLIIIPHLMSMVIVSYVVYGFLSVENGVFNKMIEATGGSPIMWYSVKKYWPFILTFVHLWKGFGYSSIVYYATVVGIDESQYEAAALDGAGPWKQTLYVTLPGLKHTAITLFLMSVGGIMYSDFGLFYQIPMHSSILASVTDTIDVYVFKAITQSNDIGRSSAIGFIQSVIGFLMVVGVNALVRKLDKDSALF